MTNRRLYYAVSILVLGQLIGWLALWIIGGPIK